MHRLAFAAATFALVVLLVGTNIPTPLYPLYQRVFGLPPLVITLVFAVYALVLIPSLLVFGPLSDVVGRRKVLIPAILVAIAAAALFAAARNTAWLFVARALQGLALGAVQGTAAAALTETEPTGDTRRAALVASLSVATGTAVGPLLAGLAGLVAAARTGSVTVVFGTTVLAGLGQGLAFGGAQADVNAVAPAQRRGDVLSSFYVMIYLGVALPVIGVGAISVATGLLVAVQIFAVIAAGACVLGVVVQRLDSRRPNRLTPGA